MKKKLLLAIVFGIVVNVLVSWSLAMWRGIEAPWVMGPDLQIHANIDSNNRVVIATDTALILRMQGWTRVVSCLAQPQNIDEPVDHGDDFHAMTILAGAPYRYKSLKSLPIPSWSRMAHGSRSGPKCLIEDGFGWPFISMRASFEVDRRGHPLLRPRYSGVPVRTVDRPSAGVGWTAAWALPRSLPLTPVWTGFFCNAVIYASAVLLVFHGERLMTFALRERRDRCVECGHRLLHKQERCPECGAARKAKAEQ